MLQPNSNLTTLLDKVSDRFHFAFPPTFNGRTFHTDPETLTVLSKEVEMWLTNPSLFIFVKCENLTPLTTSPERVIIIKQEIIDCPISKSSAIDIDKESYDYVFCVTDFVYNRNISSREEHNSKIKKLNEYKLQAVGFFAKP